MNAQSRRPYRGINFTLLSLVAEQHGYAVNRWLTFRQALDLGAHVRKGEQGTPIVFWQLRRIGVVADAFPEHDDDPPELRGQGLSAVAQLHRLQCRPDRRPGPAVQPAKCAHAGCPRRKPRSCCSCPALASGSEARERSTSRPATRSTCRAPAAFASASSYYNVALHELTHWSGHPARCNRDLTGRFGDSVYAAEELIAEMGAAYLCAHCRIDGELRHAGYIASWLKVLRGDKRAIFTAAAQAQRAADYVLRLAQPPEREAMAA